MASTALDVLASVDRLADTEREPGTKVKVKTYETNQECMQTAVLLTRTCQVEGEKSGRATDELYFIGHDGETKKVFEGQHSPGYESCATLQTPSSIEDILRHMQHAMRIAWVFFGHHENKLYLFSVHQVMKLEPRFLFVAWDTSTHTPAFAQVYSEPLEKRERLFTKSFSSAIDQWRVMEKADFDTIRAVEFQNNVIVVWWCSGFFAYKIQPNFTCVNMVDIYYSQGIKASQCISFVEPNVQKNFLAVSYDGKRPTCPCVVIYETRAVASEDSLFPTVIMYDGITGATRFCGVLYSACGRFHPISNKFTAVATSGGYSYVITFGLHGSSRWYGSAIKIDIPIYINMPFMSDMSISSKYMAVSASEDYLLIQFQSFLYEFWLRSAVQADSGWTLITPGYVNYRANRIQTPLQECDTTPGLFLRVVPLMQSREDMVLLSSQFRWTDRVHPLVVAGGKWQNGRFIKVVFQCMCVKARLEKTGSTALPVLPMSTWLVIFAFLFDLRRTSLGKQGYAHLIQNLFSS